MGKLISIYSKTPFIIITKGLSPNEWDFLNDFLKTQNIEIYYWERGRPEPYLHPNQILLTSEFSEYSLKMGYEWSLPVSIVGRLEEKERDFILNKIVVSFWDADKISMPYFLPVLGKTWEQKEVQVLLWSQNFIFSKILQSIFRFFPIQFTLTENPSFALHAIQQNDYDLIILDWDKAGLEIIQIIRELRILKTHKTLPQILGIKDFNKMHIFKDLSAGIKEFCAVLFSESEIIELFLKSFPLKENIYTYIEEKEFPILRYVKKSMSTLTIQLDYSKETRILELRNSLTWTEIERLLFREQFLWILSYFQK
ncbi:MAG: hypothetical protein N3A69_16560 [Leptospiraceae bacterium]|nr:hypothetical protein [Leptospiraceae bacterium]